MDGLGELIGGRKPIRVAGPYVGPEDVAALDSENLRQFRSDNTPESNSQALEHLTTQAHAVFKIDEETVGLVADKIRPYARLYDMMLIVADIHPETRFIRSIDDMAAEQLAHVLSIGQEMLGVYQEQSGKPMLTGISFNCHDDPLETPHSEEGYKTKAQTFPFAHAHIVGIETEEMTLGQVESPLSKSERRDIYDPATLLIKQIIGIPSIRAGLTDQLQLVGEPMEFLATGIKFGTRGEPAGNVELAGEIQTLHERFRELYQRVAGLMIDSEVMDPVGMPRLRKDRHERIDKFIQELGEEEQNQGNVDVLYRLKQNIHYFAGVLQPADNPEVVAGVRSIAMRSFADTLTLYRLPDETEWHMVIAPRIFSTGNMLASLGLIKEKPDASRPVDDKWRQDKQELIEAVKRLAEARE